MERESGRLRGRGCWADSLRQLTGIDGAINGQKRPRGEGEKESRGGRRTGGVGSTCQWEKKREGGPPVTLCAG